MYIEKNVRTNGDFQIYAEGYTVIGNNGGYKQSVIPGAEAKALVMILGFVKDEIQKDRTESKELGLKFDNTKARNRIVEIQRALYNALKKDTDAKMRRYLSDNFKEIPAPEIKEILFEGKSVYQKKDEDKDK